LARANLKPEILPTRAVGDATIRAREAARSGADLVIVAAGDGTINEAANGLAGSTTPLAVLPGGTANCLATEIGMGARVERAAERLAECVSRPVALGRLRAGDGPARHFLSMCGAGLDASIVYGLNPRLKGAVGKLAYWTAGIAHIVRRVEQLDVAAGGQTYRCGFMLASRIRNYGGDLEIARGASLMRDDFEIVLFEGSNPLRYAWYMLGVLGRAAHKMRGVRVLRAACAEVRSPAHLQIDGEYVGRALAKLDIVPGGLRLLLPPAYG
jgi:diacylglycerol kinase family enzyme